ncbi:hypothetical protein JCM10207_000505 [Rhodosporidiobolus poonsookiae]
MAALVSANPYSALPVDQAALEERIALSLRLVDAVLDHDDALVRTLVEQEHVECWVQDQQGWTALHAAAYTGNVSHVQLLLRKGNAVWSIVDNLGCTAGDIAYSMNNSAAYDVLLQEGIRSEMLRAVMDAVADSDGGDDAADGDMDSHEGDDRASQSKVEKSTASDNATFLASRLTFATDAAGQPIALDAEGNGVMMGWEEGIMRETVSRMVGGAEGPWADRKGRARDDLVREEEAGDREPLRVVNVGFGLGIVDTFFSAYSPTQHLIIEPHPDVLAFARENGWMEKEGVRFFEGTWKDYFRRLESGEEEYVAWDAIYFDTYSEHYADLHAFFQNLPDLLSPSPSANFSFFHGLGATSRSLYDVYTTVSELHLREIGLRTQWAEVDVGEGAGAGIGRWSATGEKGASGELSRTEGDGEKKYWREEMVGRYRLPICRLEY